MDERVQEQPIEADEKRLATLVQQIGSDAVWGSSRLSDAEFLATLRRRIEPPAGAFRRPVFAIPRLVPVSVVAGLALTALVFFSHSGAWQSPQSAPAAYLAEWDGLDADGFSDAMEQAVQSDTDAASLADYLSVPNLEAEELPDNFEFEDPVPEELYALTDQDLNEVLRELQQTKFF